MSKKTPPEQKVAAGVILVVGFIIGFFIVNGIKGVNKSFKETANKQTEQQATKTQVAKPNYVFDLPTLVGKNIDEVRAVLGKPMDAQPEPTKQQIELGGDEWFNGYEKDGGELTITFQATSRKITDFFLGGKSRNTLMQQGNLQENQNTYRIEEVKALTGGGITGIKIIPE